MYYFLGLVFLGIEKLIMLVCRTLAFIPFVAGLIFSYLSPDFKKKFEENRFSKRVALIPENKKALVRIIETTAKELGEVVKLVVNAEVTGGSNDCFTVELKHSEKLITVKILLDHDIAKLVVMVSSSEETDNDVLFFISEEFSKGITIGISDPDNGITFVKTKIAALSCELKPKE